MKNRKNVYRTLALITQLGISMLVPVFLCTFLGIFIENKFQISIVVPLIILGILAGGRNAYKLAVSAVRDDKDKDR